MIAVPNGVPAPARQEIAKTLAELFGADEVVELRAFHKGRKRTDAGYFDAQHRDALNDEAVRLNAAGAAVYVTLNQIDPQLLGRYNNRVKDFADATTTDANIVRRRWILLDFDPVRPKDTSATDEQVEEAKATARQCMAYLKGQGWPTPTPPISGNGMHLLYPCNLPNDDDVRDAIKAALASLTERFDHDAVKVDRSVFNAARITKLYGTVANKGDHTERTPWRVSRLTSTPGRAHLVSLEMLQALAPAPPLPGPVRLVPTGSPFDLAGFLSRLGIAFQQDAHDGAERFKLDHCPFNPEHGKGEAAIFRRSNGALGFKCQHNSCAERTWQDVRALVDGPPETRRPRAHGAARTDPQLYAGSAPAGDSVGRIAYRRASDIQAKPIRWLWQGRIARGKVSMLAGNPGLGKSQITASMAAIVSIGGSWPVDRTRCEMGNVVILSAEDDAADTIRPRLEAAGADLSRVFILDAVVEGYRSDGGEILRAFNLKTDLARLGAMLDKIGGAALIVIDPITAYLGDADSHKNAEIRALLSPLSDLAAKHGAAVVCVSHFNKATGGEALMRVTGSLAFVAAARAAFVVAKDPENEARRLFLPLKNNIGNDQTGLAFAIQSAQVKSAAGLIETSRVMWESEAVTVTADEAMTQQADPADRDEIDEAKDFLRKLLVGGPVPSKQIKADAKEAGHAWRTVHRAKKPWALRRRRAVLLTAGYGGLPTKVAKKHRRMPRKMCGSLRILRAMLAFFGGMKLGW